VLQAAGQGVGPDGAQEPLQAEDFLLTGLGGRLAQARLEGGLEEPLGALAMGVAQALGDLVERIAGQAHLHGLQLLGDALHLLLCLGLACLDFVLRIRVRHRRPLVSSTCSGARLFTRRKQKTPPALEDTRTGGVVGKSGRGRGTGQNSSPGGVRGRLRRRGVGYSRTISPSR